MFCDSSDSVHLSVLVVGLEEGAGTGPDGVAGAGVFWFIGLPFDGFRPQPKRSSADARKMTMRDMIFLSVKHYLFPSLSRLIMQSVPMGLSWNLWAQVSEWRDTPRNMNNESRVVKYS